MGNDDTNEKLYYRVFQLVCWIMLAIFILFRGVNYAKAEVQWIWIINYVGMGLAILNLFLGKCFELDTKKSTKYRPFVGLTVLVVIAVCVMAIPVYKWQSSDYATAVNDIITLLALFFSLSDNIWDFILNCIVSVLKK